MANEPVNVTPAGLQAMKDELTELKTVRRPEVISRIEKAKELGDLKENAEYHDARDDQGMIETRIAKLEADLQNAVVIQNIDTDTVSIGCTVHVSANGKDKQFTIVGPPEADPLQGRISNESPLGQAFLGKAVGESVEVKVPSGTMTYEVKSITC